MATDRPARELWPRRIAIASHDGELSGSQRAMADTCLSLQEAGVEVVAVLPLGCEQSSLAKRLQAIRVDVTLANSARWTGGSYDAAGRRWLVGGLRRLGQTMEVLAGLHVDCVISNTGVACSSAMAARRLGLPHVWMLHESLRQREGNRHLLPQPIIQGLIRHTGPVILPSRWLQREVLSWNPVSRSAVVEPAVVSDFLATPTETALRLVFPGGTYRLKRLEDAIHALGILRRAGHPIALHIFGGSEGRARDEMIKQVARQEGVEDLLQFRGVVANLNEHLDHRAIVISASEQEAFGRTVVEAMRAGALTVGAAGGATPELIEHEKTGLLFTPESPQSLADSLLRLVRDDQLRNAISRRAHDLASDRWTTRAHGGALLETLERFRASMSLSSIPGRDGGSG